MSEKKTILTLKIPVEAAERLKKMLEDGDPAIKNWMSDFLVEKIVFQPHCNVCHNPILPEDTGSYVGENEREIHVCMFCQQGLCPITGGEHRWVGGGEYGSSMSTICGDCGMDADDIPDDLWKIIVERTRANAQDSADQKTQENLQ